MDKGSVYGPVRYYSIAYDDGDKLEHVNEVYVFPKFDYLLATKMNQEWIGVKLAVDESANDRWARKVGWYEADVDGQWYPFPLLSGKSYVGGD